MGSAGPALPLSPSSIPLRGGRWEVACFAVDNRANGRGSSGKGAVATVTMSRS